MKKENLAIKIFIFFAPSGVCSLLSLIYILRPETYKYLVSEDSWIEDTQALLFSLSSVIGFLSCKRLLHLPNNGLSIILLLFALGSFLFFAEEISWGQRIFLFQTPETISALNTQTEFTFHNLRNIQPCTGCLYWIICGYAAVAWVFVRKKKLSATDVRNFVIPDWYTATYFSPIAIFYWWHKTYMNVLPLEKRYILWPQVESWRHQESFELLFAAGFLLIAITNYHRILRIDLATKDWSSPGLVDRGKPVAPETTSRHPPRTRNNNIRNQYIHRRSTIM